MTVIFKFDWLIFFLLINTYDMQLCNNNLLDNITIDINARKRMFAYV